MHFYDINIDNDPSSGALITPMGKRIIIYDITRKNVNIASKGDSKDFILL